MAIYTDEQLIQRANDVLYPNALGEIDADEVRQLIIDLIDSKKSVNEESGATVYSGTIDYEYLTDNTINITHSLNTSMPYVIIKSPTGDIWGEGHFTTTPYTVDVVTITFEDGEITEGQSVGFVVIKFG